MHCFEPGTSTEWVFWVSDQIPIYSFEIDDTGICHGVCLKISHPGTQNPDKSSFNKAEMPQIKFDRGLWNSLTLSRAGIVFREMMEGIIMEMGLGWARVFHTLLEDYLMPKEMNC